MKIKKICLLIVGFITSFIGITLIDKELPIKILIITLIIISVFSYNDAFSIE